MPRRSALFALLLTLPGIAWAAGPARAQAERERAEQLLREGDEFLRLGSYFEASERYSAAVLADPGDGSKKLAFGHALFALGHYAYASYNFRRGLRYLEYPDDLELDMAARFPGRRAVERALEDARSYLGYYPGDHHALTVLAYVNLFGGDRGEARDAARQLLEQNRRDRFAAYVLERLEQERQAPPSLTIPPRPVAEPPPPEPAEAALEGLARDLPEGVRRGPEVPLSQDEPTPALAD